MNRQFFWFQFFFVSGFWFFSNKKEKRKHTRKEQSFGTAVSSPITSSSLSILIFLLLFFLIFFNYPASHFDASKQHPAIFVLFFLFLPSQRDRNLTSASFILFLIFLVWFQTNSCECLLLLMRHLPVRMIATQKRMHHSDSQLFLLHWHSLKLKKLIKQLFHFFCLNEVFSSYFCQWQTSKSITKVFFLHSKTPPSFSGFHSFCFAA